MNPMIYGQNQHPVEKVDETYQPEIINTDTDDENVPQDALLVHEFPLEETRPTTIDPMGGDTVIQETGQGDTIIYKDHVGETFPESTNEPVTQEAISPVKTPSMTALLAADESEQFRTRWNEVQGKFVDDPRTAVQQADALVSDVVGQITKMFSDERSQLESQWKEGNDVSTEDLRTALQRYRTFFNRLVV